MFFNDVTCNCKYKSSFAHYQIKLRRNNLEKVADFLIIVTILSSCTSNIKRQ